MDFRTTLAANALIAMPAMLHAHGSMKPRHGGMVQMTGETMIELISGPKGGTKSFATCEAK